MKEKGSDEITTIVISILQSFPDGTRTSVLLKSLTGALGIALAGTARDINDDMMYEGLVDVVKEFAQREDAREVFNLVFGKVENEEE